MSDITKAKVLRYNPAVDTKPYYETYDVPWTKFLSVLEVIRYIHDEIKPIAFDYSCRGAACGLCGVMVDGKPALACVTPVPVGDVLIEPLAGFPVIRDLIVDKSEVENRLLGIRPWFSRSKPMTEPVTMPGDAYMRTAVLQECKSCLSCHVVCPVVKSKGFSVFAGPYILTKIAVRYYDTREDVGFADERLKTAVDEGLSQCILCGLCDEVCPSGKLVASPGFLDRQINHVQIFKDMMDAAKAKGWGS